MEENTPLTVLIPVAGKEATVTLTPTGTEWDRLAIAWCILAIPAINVGKNKVASPDRYLAKTIERLPEVVPSLGLVGVDAVVIFTRERLTSSSSATICRSAVKMP